MNTNEEKLVKLIGDNGFVSLSDIVSNLRVLKVEMDTICVRYYLTRTNKIMPWPAPYQAGQQIDGQTYHCCSYSTVSDEEWPEDTKELKVYRVDMA